MPWKVSGAVERRKQFVSEYGSGDWTMTELCRAYGILRPSGYEVLRRYAQAGELGLEEQSRAPERHPNQTPAAVEDQVLALRRLHPRWGPRTLKSRLERLHPQLGWPAASTIGALLAVRKVREHGAFTWKHENVFLSEVLEGERVALWPIDERYYRVYFADFPLARFDSYGLGIERLPKDEPES